MRKKITLLPILVAVLLTISANAAHAGAFILTLTDLDVPGSSITVNDDDLNDFNGSPDGIVFMGTVGSFDVQVFGTTWIPAPTGAPAQMDLSNFLISSSTGGRFTATLSRTGLASSLFSGPSVMGIANYGATFATGTTGSVTFQSWLDPANSGGAAGEPVHYAPSVITANQGAPGSATSGPAALLAPGSFLSVYSQLDFVIDSPGGSLNANTDVQVASVPEPMTLLLFGPGMLGLAAIRRRLRSKAL